jgi:hypothetical protein
MSGEQSTAIRLSAEQEIDVLLRSLLSRLPAAQYAAIIGSDGKHYLMLSLPGWGVEGEGELRHFVEAQP